MRTDITLHVETLERGWRESGSWLSDEEFKFQYVYKRVGSRTCAYCNMLKRKCPKHQEK